MRSILLVLCAALAAAGEVDGTIPNPLRQHWPWEVVGVPVGGAPTAVELADGIRPVQIAEGRAWFIARLAGGDGEKRPPATMPYRFLGAEVAPGVTLAEQDDHYLIDNGVYQFRLRRYAGISAGTPFEEIPHWCAGMRHGEDGAWDGRGWFDGDLPVHRVESEILAAGPVFVDARVLVTFAAREGGTLPGRPMAFGKRSHRYEPARLPIARYPADERVYECRIRFVMGDPWIEVLERFAFDGDGVSHTLHWGDPAELPEDRRAWNGHLGLDTATWVRWFLYDRFGGNTRQHYVPLVERPDQKGRPFANLRPRWDQRGGSTQDFVLTRGGAPPEKGEEADGGFAPGNPAVGVFAAFASKWVDPYRNTPHGFVADGDRGWVRFPLRGRGADGMAFGQRSWGLCIGPRRHFHHLNGLVRRHTDWTLQALIDRYVLEWERDPDLAGPRALIDEEGLARLRRRIEAGDTPEAAIVTGYRAEIAAIRERLPELRAAVEAATDGEGKKAAKKRLRRAEKRLRDDDARFLRLVMTGEGERVDPPHAGLWLGRRYQDDFLNPTSPPTRSVKKWADADLYAGGDPIGGAMHAALGYVLTDPDAWPGWHNGWHPGNPNFHTDKYMGAIYIGAAMADHPHAGEWLEFGRRNFLDDLRRVLLPPDGVGYECPGYSGYSLNLQLKLAHILRNLGHEDLVHGEPLFAATADWHRRLLTPPDARFGGRHEAPHGDTHRWHAGLENGFAKLATHYRDADPGLARELMATWRLQGGDRGGDLLTRLVLIDESIPAADPAGLDWSSAAYEGFGAIMRTRFGRDDESFLSFRAGRARGHYHNDQLAFHYYGAGAPLALDYNCSYHPRGDHAALHNSMTFGRGGTVRHNARKEDVEAWEQIDATARMLRFREGRISYAVAERRGGRLRMSPILPRDAEFARGYPTRTVEEIVHRRTVALVGHDGDSPLRDYVVVRDRTRSPVPQQLNLHLFAREVEEVGDGVWRARGQLHRDCTVHLVAADDFEVERRHWAYGAHGDHDPEDLIVPEDHDGRWTEGEYQRWLRVHTHGGAELVWVLYPHDSGEEVPTIRRSQDGSGVEVRLGEHRETVDLAAMEEGLPPLEPPPDD